MYLQRLLQINIATLAALGTLLLGMGQRDVWLPLLVWIAAITSIWLTDVTGWFRLNRTVANVAAAVAVVISVRELIHFTGSVQILGIANLLIYLQIILLFQEKDDRTYWQLVMLSLLQVVMATAFSQGVWFGLLLVVYMLVGLSALALLLLHRQWSRRRPAETLRAPPAVTGARWPLSGQKASFIGSLAGPLHAGIGRELLGRLGMMGLGTLLLTGLLFLTVPRLGRTAWRGALIAPRRVVGFSDKVFLGELGKTFESREEVMRIRFFDHATSKPYRVRGEVYLYGAMLLDYAHGQWAVGIPSDNSSLTPLEKTGGPLPPELVRQECTIEPLQQDELFCVMPLVAIESNQNVVVDRLRRRLLRRNRLRRGRFHYKLGTTAFADGVQRTLLPCKSDAPADHAFRATASGGPDDLPNLTALADRWIAESGLPPEDRYGRARCLERMLSSSGRFQYSLEPQRRDESIDPIEDFLTKHPRGHCEYFATALTLMLRSQGIPARMVVGYKTDEFNDLGNFFQVRQLHAHTWVEAHLQGKHIPQERLRGNPPERWADGGWLRLEPTPGASLAARTDADRRLAERIRRVFRRIQDLWTDYVVEMDRNRQRAWWRGVLAKTGEVLRFAWQRGWSSWLALATLVMLPLLAFVVCRLWRPRWRLWGRLAGRTDSAAQRSRAEVEFYRRLEAALAAQGLVRTAGQTQREFALTAGARIAQITGRRQLASLPPRVVEAFYRVRFGCLPLDKQRAQAVEHALEELEQLSGSV